MLISNINLLSSSSICTVAVSGEPWVTLPSLVAFAVMFITAASFLTLSATSLGSVATCTLVVLLPLNVAVKRPPV